MQSSSLTSTMPSSARLKLAPVGQTVTQGASAQCRQDLGKWTTRGGAGVGDGLEAVDVVEESALGVGAVGVEVGEGREAAAGGVPLLAGDDAGVAADAGVEVDDEAEGALRAFREICHASPMAFGTRNKGVRTAGSAGTEGSLHLARQIRPRRRLLSARLCRERKRELDPIPWTRFLVSRR